jgi:hypothetical protein
MTLHTRRLICFQAADAYIIRPMGGRFAPVDGTIPYQSITPCCARLRA